MNILLIAPEAVPYCKTSGLADVVYGLARELRKQHNDVRLVIPCYRGVLDRTHMQEIVSPLKGVPLGIYKRDATIWKSENREKGFITYLVQNDFYFGRNDIYGYLDDYERFIFFTRAALEMLCNIVFREHEKDWFPHIIQGYDSIAGFIPSWLPAYSEKDSRFDDSRFILFVNNNSKLGLCGNRALRLAQLEHLGTYPQISETSTRINVLGRGMLFADKLVTVNPHIDDGNPLPTHTSEILKPVIDKLAIDDRAIGIHNAIDYDEFNPADDTAIEKCFNERTLHERVQNKLALQKESGFEQGERIPLIGMVSRLMPQKGFELLPQIRKYIQSAGNVQFVILADPGDPAYMLELDDWKRQKNGEYACMEVFYGFNDSLARRIYASCDLFLLPSKEEGSNTQQLIAMRYGAIPIVHHTGFFKDTVQQYSSEIELDDSNSKRGIGFTFKPFIDAALFEALNSALKLYTSDFDTWSDIQRYNMRKDFSWFGPAKKYNKTYQEVLKIARVPFYPGEKLPVNSDRDTDLLQTLLEIDSIPGLVREASEDTLKQVARLVREVVGADAVYVSRLSEDIATAIPISSSQQMQIVTDSFNEADQRTPPDREKINALINKGTIVLWPQFADLDMAGLCRPIGGLDDELAQREKWSSGYSVPVIAHGRVLGRLDVFFTKNDLDFDWVTSALTTLSNSLGFRLEAIRLRREADRILEMGNAFLQAQSYNQAIKLTQEWARQLSHADVVWVYENKDGLNHLGNSAQAEFGVEIARQAAETREVVYIPDWRTKPNSQNLQVTYRSVMATPILGYLNNLFGVVVVAKDKPAAFSRDDEQILRNQLSSLAANAMETTRLQEERGRNWVEQLGSLSNSLTGSQELKDLVARIVETIARVVGAEASSLYLIDKANNKLVIQAAAGYQKPLVEKRAEYDLGVGVTGTIAKLGNTVRANSIEELHKSPGWKGQQNPGQGGREPNSFLGLPLKVRDRFTNKEEIIGVLKVEDIVPSENHPEKIFTDQDVLLVTMMANVIATVVYNTQASGAQLQELGSSLSELSNALAGGREMRDLVDQVVETMARVLHAQASSLYLIDKVTKKLVIQAAAGYQKPLVEKRAEYDLGVGVTGTIAKLGNTVRANSIEDLHKSPGWVGKQNLAQGGHEPNSYLGLPLRVRDRFTGKEEIIGVLKVEDIVPSENHPESIFTDQDVLLVTMMANVISTVVYNTQASGAQLQELGSSLGELSNALAGGREMRDLVDQVVETMARVLHAQASSLYLIDKTNDKLVIQAAAGYQKPLVEKRAGYVLGEGVTGTIAKLGNTVRANSIEDLHKSPGWAGKQNPGQGGREPNSFLGLPLKVRDRFTGKEKIIGVLKVEDIVPSENHPEAIFTEQDVQLVTMMANVISTVVYNTQASGAQLQELGNSLSELSNALAGGREMRDLVDQVVETMARVLHAQASSLYLIDKATNKLAIQAASGYQKPLVEKRAEYVLGEGVTGTIAKLGNTVRANSIEELHKSPGWVGKQNPGQGGREPNSYLGLPLKVRDRFTGREEIIGVLKVEDIVPSENHPETIFTDQDVLLVTMMANVIATFISNTRWGEARVGDILQQMGMLSVPAEAAPELLENYARSADLGILDQLATAIAGTLDKQPDHAEVEAQALFKAKANPVLYGRIASWAKHTHVRWAFALLREVFSAKVIPETWHQVSAIAEPWQQLEQALDSKMFATAAQNLMVAIANQTQLTIGVSGQDANSIWHGIVLDTEKIFGNNINRLPFFFQQQGSLDEDNVDRLRKFAQDGLHQHYSVLVLVSWALNLSQKEASEAQDILRKDFVDLVILDVSDIFRIMQSPDPSEVFRRQVLRQVRVTPPYVIRGAVPAKMFFGRDAELRRLIESAGAADFAILGNRRIGKTSLLHATHSQLEAAGRVSPLLIDCQTVKSTSDFFVEFQAQQTQVRLTESTPAAFVDMATRYRDSGKPIVLLMDEVDELLHYEKEHGETLLAVWRQIAQAKICHFIFCGSRNLAQDVDNPHHLTLYNFPQPLPLGCLDSDTARRVLTEPLEALGIDMEEKEELIKQVMQLTSGHPYLIQYVGWELVSAANAPQRIERKILLSDLDDLRSSAKFADEYLGTIWGNIGPLEKLITLLAPR